MPEDFSSLDVTWFAYGLAVAGRYNSMVVDGLIEEVKDDVQFGELSLGNNESSSGGGSS